MLGAFSLAKNIRGELRTSLERAKSLQTETQTNKNIKRRLRTPLFIHNGKVVYLIRKLHSCPKHSSYKEVTELQ